MNEGLNQAQFEANKANANLENRKQEQRIATIFKLESLYDTDRQSFESVIRGLKPEIKKAVLEALNSDKQ